MVTRRGNDSAIVQHGPLAYQDLFDRRTKLVELEHKTKPVKLPSRIDQLEARMTELERRLDAIHVDLTDVEERSYG